MNKLLLALGLSLISTISLAQTAQDGQRGGDRAEDAARMKGELGLSDEQVREMRDIRETGGSRKDMRAVLTPEQEAKAAELRQAEQGIRHDRMKEQLGLSDEQMEQIKEIREAGGSGEEIRAVLTPEQQAKMGKMRESRSMARDEAGEN